NEVDPLGLGIIDRSKRKSWNEKDFYKNIYPKMKFSIQTNIKIRQSGVGQ
ncbi:Ger(x)C family spore germination C-terminal domain-containing protein, partial [Gottfriedia acidiceleris]